MEIEELETGIEQMNIENESKMLYVDIIKSHNRYYLFVTDYKVSITDREMTILHSEEVFQDSNLETIFRNWGIYFPTYDPNNAKEFIRKWEEQRPYFQNRVEEKKKTEEMEIV